MFVAAEVRTIAIVASVRDVRAEQARLKSPAFLSALRLRRSQCVRGPFKAGAARSQRRVQVQGAAGPLVLGRCIRAGEVAASRTYWRKGGRLRNLRRICMCVLREGGRRLCSKKNGHKLVRDKRAASSATCCEEGRQAPS